MSREADFWRWYAEKNDELRHELVERPWYGREVTGAHEQTELSPPDIEPSIWDNEQATPEGEGIHQGAETQELYGEAAPGAGADIEPPQMEPPQIEQEA